MNKSEIAPSAWNFKLDEMEMWAYYNDVFTADECQKIIDIGTQKSLHKGIIGGPKASLEKAKGFRHSDIAWLSGNDMEWVFRRLTDKILYLNSKFFKFNIWGLQEGLQFTRYQAPKGYYKRHVDRSKGFLIRKLSITVQLSDPQSYKGGELLIHTGALPTTLPKTRGCLFMFPSYTLHEVTEMTEGERYSLVGWITGEPFK